VELLTRKKDREAGRGCAAAGTQPQGERTGMRDQSTAEGVTSVYKIGCYFNTWFCT